MRTVGSGEAHSECPSQPARGVSEGGSRSEAGAKQEQSSVLLSSSQGWSWLYCELWSTCFSPQGAGRSPPVCRAGLKGLRGKLCAGRFKVMESGREERLSFPFPCGKFHEDKNH